MVDLVLLRKVIKDSGITQQHIANKLELSRYSLYKKLKGEVGFSLNEVVLLSRVLHLPNDLRDQIFLNEKLTDRKPFIFGTNEENQVAVSTASSMESLGGYVNASGEWVCFRGVIYVIIPDDKATQVLDEIREV